MKKSLSVVFVAALTVTVACSGCAGGGNTSVLKDGDHAELRLMAGGTQWQGTYLENLTDFVNDFNDGKLGEEAKALNITITLDPVSDMASTYPTRLRSATRYPHLMLFDRFNTPEYVNNDFILDLTGMFQERNIDASLYTPAAMTEMIVDDKMYGLPIDLDLWGIYVNTDMVAAYNEGKSDGEKIVLDSDWTWTEFMDIAQKLTKGSGDNKVAGYYTGDLHEHFYKYFLTTGEDFLTSSNVPNMDNDAAKAVLEFFKEMKDSGISKSVEAIGFPRGQVAMYTQATYYADYIKRMNPDIHYKFMPMPKAERTGYTFANAQSGGMFGGFGLVVPKPIQKIRDEVYDSYVKRSVDLLEWWTTGEGARYWAQYTETMPALNSLREDSELMSSQVLQDAVGLVSKYQIRPQLPGYMNYQIYTVNSNVTAYLDGTRGLADTLEKLKDTSYLLG